MPKIHNKKKGDGIYVTVRSKGVRRGHKHQLAHVSKKWCIVETDVIFYTSPLGTYHVCSEIWNIYEKMLRRRGDVRSGAQACAHTGRHFVLFSAESIGQVFTIGQLFFYTEFRNSGNSRICWQAEVHVASIS